MKTIGLLGGMSWESSAQYYAILNRAVRDRTATKHSARSLMLSVDFAEFRRLMAEGEWDRLGARLIAEAQSLERGGADCVLLCTNTMHFAAEAITAALSVPLIHIVDAVARPIVMAGIERVGLIGTRFTMEQPFFRDRLESEFGVEVLVPGAGERSKLHAIIFDELVDGIVAEPSRAALAATISGLAAQGAEGVILGCTEFMLIADPAAAPVPLFDTTTLHAEAAADFALTDHTSSTSRP